QIRVSGLFRERWQKWLQQGYRPQDAAIGYIVLWFDKTERKYYRVPLPQMRLISGSGAIARTIR
ncbi:MAG TPA: hypothetical protein V6D23_11990, partial [Candidatus Obscuribacterales bacterium]